LLFISMLSGENFGGIFIFPFFIFSPLGGTSFILLAFAIFAIFLFVTFFLTAFYFQKSLIDESVSYQVTTGKMFKRCIKCGAILPIDAAYCLRCGAYQGEEE